MNKKKAKLLRKAAIQITNGDGINTQKEYNKLKAIYKNEKAADPSLLDILKDKIYRLGLEVCKSKDDFGNWLVTPNAELKWDMPSHHMRNIKEAKEVYNQLLLVKMFLDVNEQTKSLLLSSD